MNTPTEQTLAQQQALAAAVRRIKRNFEYSDIPTRKPNYPAFTATVREKTNVAYAPVSVVSRRPKKSNGMNPAHIVFEQRVLDSETGRTVRGKNEFKPLKLMVNNDEAPKTPSGNLRDFINKLRHGKKSK